MNIQPVKANSHGFRNFILNKSTKKIAKGSIHATYHDADHPNRGTYWNDKLVTIVLPESTTTKGAIRKLRKSGRIPFFPVEYCN